MRYLYQQIYLSFIAILFIFLVLVAVVVHGLARERVREPLSGVGSVINEFVFPVAQTGAELQATTERLADLLDIDIAVVTATGDKQAAAGAAITIPKDFADKDPGNQEVDFDHGSLLAVRLPDNRWVLLRSPDHTAMASQRLLIAITLMGIAIAIGAYPVARRITRRLERLQTRVEALGEGDLSARIDVEGRDEVATLTDSFNKTAVQIEQLVNAQRQVLAGVSHEIRTPLARMRLALDLLNTDDRPELRKRFLQDLTELDDLIGELLLASRLQTMKQLCHTEEIDFLALVVEESARFNALVNGTPTEVRGESKMLRRMIRNLLENAERYGGEGQIELTVNPIPGGGTLLTVRDHGPGVSVDEFERIFEPFYQSKQVRDQSDKNVGLGLSLVKQIAHSHGGDVLCKPLPEGGTLFEVTLNLA